MCIIAITIINERQSMYHKIRVLIIEDEVLTALRLKQIINSHEYEVVFSASNAEAALSFIQSNPIDIVLADINLQGDKTGFDVAKALQPYHLAIIFITACTDKFSLQEASQINYSSYIVKPFTSDDVLTSIKLAVLKNNLEQNNISLGNGYVYHRKNKKLFYNNLEILLTTKEQELFTLLINAKNSICTIETIDNKLWNDKPINDATRRNLLFKLKQKLPDIEIKTYKGIGYQIQLVDTT